ncbi:hypothetical protein BDA96_06G034900 [Sorghum bicolor]|uniref:Uncharacterized protein n=2 Tax=Sorghum bicolor TaxID=4558 RepID=A0A921QNZ6_SORBI|nr:hypothetical protein BDA96_06G034900 [Sorghum bicolor]OQU81237.1 hypothetical protein SORBI_3006G032033 [Sorghum bicolor]
MATGGSSSGGGGGKNWRQRVASVVKPGKNKNPALEAPAPVRIDVTDPNVERPEFIPMEGPHYLHREGDNTRLPELTGTRTFRDIIRTTAGQSSSSAPPPPPKANQ